MPKKATKQVKAFNFATETEYTGDNAALVSNFADDLPAFATFNQINGLGYQVKKGAKSISIFCGYVRRAEKGKRKTEVQKTIPLYARVFDIADTTAADDKEFIKHLRGQIKAGAIKISAIAAEQRAASIVMEAISK